jgi:tetratricopeptide (TPR) repeat protein
MKRIICFQALFILILFPVSAALAQVPAPGKDWVARIESVEGSVLAQKAGQANWVKAGPGDVFCAGDKIEVLENSRAAIFLPTGAIVRLNQKTTIAFLGIEDGKTSVIDLIKGIALFFSRNPFSLRVNTPFVNANVEGTEFLINVESDQASISVFDGKLHASDEHGSLILERGQSAICRVGAPPVFNTIAKPKDAVHWALYYPPIPEIASNVVNSATGSRWGEIVSASVNAYRKGDVSAALASLSMVPINSDSALLDYRALLLLTVGRVDEASAVLAEALDFNPQDSYALALQSVMAVARNRKDLAFDLARRALDSDPSSAAALMALSYAQQARFDLKGALGSIEKAINVNPQDAYAWARLSELRLCFGYLDSALDSAKQAVSLDPAVSRTQTVLGFAFLTRIDIENSKKAFKKAIELDQADPLPRLGIGLAIIRSGDLKRGTVEIEIAAMLDPLNPLIRSYLGKAYFDEKQSKLASEEFRLAKELDPLDPTPWFYDAIQKETLNRPVEAMEDIQKSIELNDNRAVYRSRLLLDEDLAARSASLARIYNDLGFDQLALVEGWKSVSMDPANFSAHRFLSDSYSAVPRYEIARVSELLQSQLLQPLNINPIQPSLAESYFVLPQSQGPASPSINEYNSLFNRNGVDLLVDGVGGNHGIVGEEVTFSGIYDKYSFSAGQLHFATDGFRQNNDITQNIYTAFMQASLTPSTSVQTEFRHKDIGSGDTQVLFDPNNFSPTLRQDSDINSIRFGFHHQFAPGSDLIGYYIHSNAPADFLIPSFYNERNTEIGDGGEVQHLYRSENFNLITGAGYSGFDRTETIDFLKQVTKLEPDAKRGNVYAYSQFHYPENVVWTFGASADLYQGGVFDLDRKQLNPKIGVMWTPFPNTTIRAAGFRAMSLTNIQNQTIEPTQVAGFNQFFDDPEGFDTWVYGVGLDQKLGSNFYLGGEILRRDIEAFGSLFSDQGKSLGTGSADWREYIGRFYLCWTPHPWLAIGPQYQFEQFQYSRDLAPYSTLDITTHRFLFGASFFHPCGIFARITPTYVIQCGDFQNPYVPGFHFYPGENNFFVLDAVIGYRLPKRFGFVSLEARNLFDRSFSFQDTDPTNPNLVPCRFIMGRYTFYF